MRRSIFFHYSLLHVGVVESVLIRVHFVSIRRPNLPMWCIQESHVSNSRLEYFKLRQHVSNTPCFVMGNRFIGILKRVNLISDSAGEFEYDGASENITRILSALK